MPEHRLRNGHFKSNRYNSAFQHLKMEEIFRDIDALEGPKGHGNLALLISPDKSYRWNFSAMKKDHPSSCTIEFRQPPGSSTMEDALLWPQLTINFVSAVFLKATLIDLTHVPTLDEFRGFLKQGSPVTRNIDQDDIDQLFAGKKKMDEGPLEEESVSSEDLEYARAGEPGTVTAEQKLKVDFTGLSFNRLLKDAD